MSAVPQYVTTDMLAQQYSSSADYFLKQKEHLIKNIHYIQKGKFLRWNITEIERWFKGDFQNKEDEVVDKLIDNLLK